MGRIGADDAQFLREVAQFVQSPAQTVILGVAVGQADVIAALGDVKSNYETGIFPVVQRAGVGQQRVLFEAIAK